MQNSMTSADLLTFAGQALENILYESVDDVLDRPFELDLLLESTEAKQKLLKATVSRAQKWIHGPRDGYGSAISHIYFPKNTAGMRKCANIDIFDMLFYLTLVLPIAPQVEQYRLPVSDNVVFSYRFNPHKRALFDPLHNYTAFRVETGKRLRDDSVKYLVRTDIENFYDRVNLHRIESQLISAGAAPPFVKAINELLMHWSNRDSYGLPVGNNASRILAEIALADIDRHLVAEKINFIRFVDDYRLFPPNVSTAYRWIEILAERLSQDGLMLNGHKTRIRPKIEALDEFKNVVSRKPPKDLIEAEKRAAPFTQYSGTFPRKFRRPSHTSLAALREIDLSSNLSLLPDSALSAPSEFTQSVLAIYAQSEWGRLSELADISLQLPRFLPYTCDFFAKIGEKLDDSIRSQISKKYSDWLEQPEIACMEYAIYSLSSLLGSKDYDAHTNVVDFFLKHQSTISPALGRAIIASLKPTISRANFIRMRRRFTRMNQSEKRQFIEIGKSALHPDELRPFAKVLSLSDGGDPLTRLLCDHIKSWKQ